MIRVGILEDDYSLLMVMRETLSEAGYQVFGVDRSRNVPAWVDAVQPDVLILDLMMPGLSGIGVAAQLDAMGYRVPLIITSGHLPPEMQTLGGHRTLPKPFDVSALLAAVREVTGRPPRPWRGSGEAPA